MRRYLTRRVVGYLLVAIVAALLGGVIEGLPSVGDVFVLGPWIDPTLATP